MAEAMNEMTLNADTHWPAMLRMAAAWSQMQGAHTAHAMVDLLRSNAMAATVSGQVHELPSASVASTGEAGPLLRP